MRTPFTERASDAIREWVNGRGDDHTLPKRYAGERVFEFCEGASRFGEIALICNEMCTGLASHQFSLFPSRQFKRVVGILQRYFERVTKSGLCRLTNGLPNV